MMESRRQTKGWRGDITKTFETITWNVVGKWPEKEMEYVISMVVNKFK